ncbi:UPF0182 family protein [Actinomyces sp. B33]|uniref:UPF0182 family membrane protein n=1 Tax=Actinomyces sp. B33 TaxID=2942131 RepID=UPI0023426AE0|nr:UPF0182 family protein [Actinomyces sp. B33]MDC4233865.1 UPF0182 family protein [Actinomyces sp. B33]
MSLTLLVLVGLGALIYAASIVWTEILWFRQMSATRIILTQWGAHIGLFLIGFAVVFAITFSSMRIAYRHRAASTRGEASASLREYQAAFEPLRSLAFWGVSLFFAFTSGASLAGQWQTLLQFINRTEFGTVDPQFGLDASFFVFTLPALRVLVSFLLKAVTIALIAGIVVHYLYGTIRLSPRPHASRPARIQLSILAAAASLLIGANYWLDRYSLLTKRGSTVDGATYTDIAASLPAHSILAVISLLVAGLFVFTAFKGSWRLPAIGVGVTVIAAVVLAMAYPALIQQFRVTPNERALESEYIQRNIDATLTAYGLDDLEYTNYDAETTAQAGQLREDSESTSQIRLLDPQVITKTVQQLQQSRPYYGFDSGMKVDRYTVDGEQRDTVIAVREINLDGLSAEQRTWVNMHTVYTHGYGVVAAYGNTLTGDGLPSYWEQSVPSVGEMGDYEERVYFSPGAPRYSIVGAPEGADPQELDYPDDNAPGGQVSTTFSGDGGPSVGNLWNKLLYSIKFASTDIFFSSQTNSESQILYDRDPLLRVSKVAPYLTLEQEAYPAVVDMDDDPATPKRLVWVVDAYTTTDQYPYSQHESLEETTVDSQSSQIGEYVQAETINYMRNSVKAVVDAYDGSVRLFRWDDQDPILSTWMKIYPQTVEPIDAISGDLMSHLRYPEDMFKVQRELLTSYHVTNASDFYAGGDRWRLAEETSTAVPGAQQTTVDENGNTVSTRVATAQPPYYLTMQMPTQESAEFSLTSVFVPGGESRREAMAGFLAVDSETGSKAGKVRDGYGKMRLLALPSSTTAPGPGQVQNAYDSNERIATQLNLLNQADSTVIRGNLLTLPVGGGLLYVQPVYVQGTGSASYPVLRSVLTAFGNQVGFASTLEESLNQTFGGDAAATVAGEQPESEGDDGGGETGAVATAQERLTAALARASEALTESSEALAAGDWTAYGAAQKKLDAAIAEAVAAQTEAGQPVPGAGADAEGPDRAQSGAAPDAPQSNG